MCHGNQEPCIKNEEQLSFPTQALVSGTVYREYINVDSKRIKVNEMVQLMEKITTGTITLFTLTEMQGGGQTDVIVMTLERHLTRFHTMACYTNCLSVALMTLHCSG